MVWDAFSTEDIAKQAILEHKQTAESYRSTLQTFMLPYAYVFQEKNLQFMPDGANIHIARNCNEWFCTLSIDVLLWTANSTDLN